MNEKILIVNLKSGLCNQLNCISKSIILASLSNRSLFFNKFQVDYKNENNLINFTHIIDINELQKLIYYHDLKVKIIENLDDEYLKKSVRINKDDTIKDISYIKNFIDVLKENDDVELLNIEAPISAEIPLEYTNKYNIMTLNLPFSDLYNKYSEKIKKKFDLDNYICIHLRLENDCINYMMSLTQDYNYDKYNNLYKEIYETELYNLISTNWNTKIYICTSLGIYENDNNDYYKHIKTKYNLIDKNDLVENNKNNECRELFGIIDYLIARDSNYFIGCDWSSFSILIYTNHKLKNKESKLLNLWSSSVNISENKSITK